jgi:nucleotide-binding universal stress UspA family protein
VFTRVLIALQRESEAPQLAALARQLVSGSGAAALALHVRRVAGDEDKGDERYDDAEAIASAGAATAVDLGLPAEFETLTIDRDQLFGRAIADVAHGWRADVIVMGSRRLGDFAAALHGSVSHDVIRLADCPVVIAGDGLTELRSILLAVDDSPAARSSEDLTRRLALEHGASVTVAHVPRPFVASGFAAGGWYLPPTEVDPVSEDVVARLRTAGVTASKVPATLYPPIAAAIAEAAEEAGADLVVIGSRGLGELAALVRGSISHELLHETRRPVLVTKSPPN